MHDDNVKYEYDHGINWTWFYPLNGDKSFRIHRYKDPELLAKYISQGKEGW